MESDTHTNSISTPTVAAIMMVTPLLPSVVNSVDVWSVANVCVCTFSYEVVMSLVTLLVV